MPSAGNIRGRACSTREAAGPALSPIAVVTAREAGERDAGAIAAGTPSRTLMARAGAAAAAEIALRFPRQVARGAAILAGPGNNGGDAWVIARALAAAGVCVRVLQVGEARSPDAIAERALAAASVEHGAPEGEDLIIDGLLGTGAAGTPRGDIASAVALIEARRRRDSTIVALDVPTGVDATTGVAEGAVTADLTLTFGTMKRGLLVARQQAGAIAVLDIGLGAHGVPDEATPCLVDAAFVRRTVPALVAEAHKGTRGKLAIIGGGPGMAGAAILAARGAARTGIGMIRLLVAPPNVVVAQTTAYDALAAAWPASDDAVAALVTDWADGVLIGPGLGRTPESRQLVEQVLRGWQGPVVLDADALNVFEGAAGQLASLLGGRPALITPHVGEMARLTGRTAREVLDERFDIGAELARALGAAVLLKGVPTIVTSAAGPRFVSASGTPVLATAGSGDLLAGVAATLVTQGVEPAASGACAAWVHGRAGELASRDGVRGVSLDEVSDGIARAWQAEGETLRYPVLAELPMAGGRR